MFGMEVHWDNRLSLIPHCSGNFIDMATTVKPHSGWPQTWKTWKTWKLREFEKLSKSQGKLREI